MKSRSTFYANRTTGEKIYLDQFGLDFTISGMILAGKDKDLLVYLPCGNTSRPQEMLTPSPAEWASLLATLDDPNYFQMEPDGKTVKAIHRKCQRKIGAVLQWQVYHRDLFRCAYCDARAGVDNVTLTIDHFIPVQHGGTDDISNLLTCCRNCNKAKGSLQPEKYLSKYEYERLSHYLKGQKWTTSLSLD